MKHTLQPRLMPRVRVVVGDREIALGPGKAQLLGLVHKTGSIREAAKEMKMSYMRAWLLIQTMNRCFQSPLIEAERGGQGRGGARLTETGREALDLYEKIEATCIEKNQKNWRRLSALLRK